MAFLDETGLKYFWDKIKSGMVDAKTVSGYTVSSSVPSDISGSVIESISTASPNSVFRGKYLGTSVTSDQLADISNGTFKLVQLGDYWTISGHNWRNWGANWYKNRGETQFTKNHIVVMPDDNLLKSDGSTTHYMNTSNSTEGGFVAMPMWTTYIPQMATTIKNIFGTDHVLSHRELLTTAVSNGASSNWAWYDATVMIPNEAMLYGKSWGNSGFEMASRYGILPLAQVKPEYICNRENYWLSDVVSASVFALVSVSGCAARNGASGAGNGVRPFFLLG